MKPQHIATIGVAGVFAAVATSAITFAEFKLINTGRDVVTAFLLPGQDQPSIVDSTRSSYVASDFEPSTKADGANLVSELKSELGQDCPKAAPIVEIWAAKQPNSIAHRTRVAPAAKLAKTRTLARPEARRESEIQAPAAVPGMTLASEAPQASKSAQPAAMVIHLEPGAHLPSAPLPNEAALRLASTKLKAMEAEFNRKGVWTNVTSLDAKRFGSWAKFRMQEGGRLPNVRVVVGGPGSIELLPADASQIQNFVSEHTLREFRAAQEEVRRDLDANKVDIGN